MGDGLTLTETLSPPTEEATPGVGGESPTTQQLTAAAQTTTDRHRGPPQR